MDIAGKIVSLLDEFQTQSGKKKYGFVLETVGQYAQKIPFEVWGDEKWQQMGVVVGSFVSVSFDISGREWNGKWFVSLNAWKVVRNENGSQSQSQEQTAVKNGTRYDESAESTESSKSDDLPF